MTQITVMGAGSWGTTVAAIAADAGNPVMLWARQEDVAQRMQVSRENYTYLPGFMLPEGITVTADPRQALEHAEIVITGVPSQSLRSNLESWARYIPEQALLVNISKGIEKDTELRMSQVLAQGTGRAENDPTLAVLSGPNLAGELALKHPAAASVACANADNAKKIQQALLTDYFRPYTNQDVVGTEIGGACKNVIALACGIAAGLNYGSNTISEIITLGLREITELGVSLGGNAATFTGMSGLGDLVATCSSQLSRNRTFGVALGRGSTLEEAALATQGQLAEGVTSSLGITQLAQSQGVHMPITEAVMDVCHDCGSIQEWIKKLSALPVGSE